MNGVVEVLTRKLPEGKLMLCLNPALLTKPLFGALNKF
jgi:hypothetical protein